MLSWEILTEDAPLESVLSEMVPDERSLGRWIVELI